MWILRVLRADRDTMLNSENYNLRAYSDGHIGWREACSRLGLDSFGELKSLLEANNFSEFSPNTSEYRENIDAVDEFLYDDWED